MKDSRGSWLRRLLILPPILIGAAILFGATAVKQPPERTKSPEKPVPVRAIKAAKTNIIPRTSGYGVVQPARVWQGVAKVSGPVVKLHPRLKPGVILQAGEALLHIDSSEYQLALEQVDAELAAAEIKISNAEQLLPIEQRNLDLLKEDEARKSQLRSAGSTPQTTLDAARRATLAAQTKLQSLKNTIAELTAEKKVLAARRANAALDLERTVMKAPFDLRITEVLTEEAQFANKGQVLVKADGIDQMDVTAHIPMGRLRFLVRGTGGAGWLLQDGEEPSGPLQLDAVVRSKRPHGTISWPAKVSRIASNLDPQTQTVGIVVSVEDPYGKAVPGQRPILAPDTFVEVELSGRPLEDEIVVPASALHQGKLYVVNEENRLDIRPAQVKFYQGSFAVLAKGASEGDLIVLTELVPAVDGMLLKPENDKKRVERLAQEAQGKTPVGIDEAARADKQ